jgi:hypothetical protein
MQVEHAGQNRLPVIEFDDRGRPGQGNPGAQTHRDKLAIANHDAGIGLALPAGAVEQPAAGDNELIFDLAAELGVEALRRLTAWPRIAAI